VGGEEEGIAACVRLGVVEHTLIDRSINIGVTKEKWDENLVAATLLPYLGQTAAG
jgi:hypothetical protein